MFIVTTKGEAIMIHAGYNPHSATLSLTTSKGTTIEIPKDHKNLDLEEKGLSQKEIKEVEKALKRIAPLFDFLSPKSTFNPSEKNIQQKVTQINDLIPKGATDKMTSYLKTSLSTKLEEMQKAFKANDDTVKLARDVFSQLDLQMKSLNLYA